MSKFLNHLWGWSKKKPLSFWGVLIQCLGFSIYFSFVNIYLASLFLALFVGYLSAHVVQVFIEAYKEE